MKLTPNFLQAASNISHADVTLLSNVDYSALTAEQVEAMTYNETQAAVKALGIATVDRKWETLKAALLEHVANA